MQQKNSKQAVVLGAAGFVGRHVCRALSAQGVKVIGLGHGSWIQSEWRQWGLSDWVEADISLNSLNALQLEEAPFSIIHCAGSGAVSYSYTNPLEDFQRAVQTTASVLEWARHLKEPRCRVVIASSAAVYGDQGDTDATEASVRAPISPYGFHKLSAETLCDSYSRFFDVPVSIVRLFSVYGEGLRKQLLWDALNKFGRGEMQFFGTGHELRDWIHVDDASRLLCAAACMPQSNFEIYNGGNQKATTKQVLSLLANAAFGSWIEPGFNGQTHTGNPRRLTADCGHARRLLAWEPYVTLEEGVPRYTAWFKQNANLQPNSETVGALNLSSLLDK